MCRTLRPDPRPGLAGPRQRWDAGADLPSGSTAITVPFPQAALPPDLSQPRARGQVDVSVRRRGTASVLDDLYQSGSLKLLFPRGTGEALQAVLVNTAGGITGGDRLSVAARARAGTRLTLTTQAAERAYRAQPGTRGRVRTELAVEAGARLDWLPQETILFDRSALDRQLTVRLARGASLLLAETLVFGRAAMGEQVAEGRLRDAIALYRGKTPLFLDRIRMEGGIARHLARPTVAGGAGALATVLYVAPDAEARLDPVRAMLPDTAGASLPRDDLLVIRLLAPDSHHMRGALVPLLTRLGGTALPRPWTI